MHDKVDETLKLNARKVFCQPYHLINLSLVTQPSTILFSINHVSRIIVLRLAADSARL